MLKIYGKLIENVQYKLPEAFEAALRPVHSLVPLVCIEYDDDMW